MADLKVEVVKIEEVNDHENADRLSIATVFGYSVVVGKDQYKSGDCAVYFPVDSILPAKLSTIIFEDTTMKPVHRIRAARIRGCVSQGLLVDIPKIKKFLLREEGHPVERTHWRAGRDLTEELFITKHDPEKNKPAILRGHQAKKRDCHPLFRKYYQIQHLLKYDKCFDKGDAIWETEKLHGTNFRAGWVPTVARSFIDRLRVKLSSCKWAWVRKFSLPEYTFVYGSHNVQLKPAMMTYYGYEGDTGKTNVYEQCVLANDLPSKIGFDQVWYGEIIGPGIQKGYSYGMDEGTYDVRFFDILRPTTGQYHDFLSMQIIVHRAGLKTVPARQTFYDKARTDKLLNDPPLKSGIDGKTLAEGLVIRSYHEEPFLGSGRKVLKLISDEYLLNKTNTENK